MIVSLALAGACSRASVQPTAAPAPLQGVAADAAVDAPAPAFTLGAYVRPPAPFHRLRARMTRHQVLFALGEDGIQPTAEPSSFEGTGAWLADLITPASDDPSLTYPPSTLVIHDSAPRDNGTRPILDAARLRQLDGLIDQPLDAATIVLDRLPDPGPHVEPVPVVGYMPLVASWGGAEWRLRLYANAGSRVTALELEGVTLGSIERRKLAAMLKTAGTRAIARENAGVWTISFRSQQP